MALPKLPALLTDRARLVVSIPFDRLHASPFPTRLLQDLAPGGRSPQHRVAVCVEHQMPLCCGFSHLDHHTCVGVCHHRRAPQKYAVSLIGSSLRRWWCVRCIASAPSMDAAAYILMGKPQVPAVGVCDPSEWLLQWAHVSWVGQLSRQLPVMHRVGRIAWAAVCFIRLGPGVCACLHLVRACIAWQTLHPPAAT